MKRFFSVLALSVLIFSSLTAAAPTPTITVLSRLPEVMEIGQSYTVQVQVDSGDQQFLFAQALPSFQYVGKGVVAVKGGDHAGRSTSALLEVTFKAKSSTAMMPDGVAPVHVVVGVRYPGGYVVAQDFLFNVHVP